MMRVVKSAVIYPIPLLESKELCLYTRRDVYPDGSYREYSYLGPADEVNALSKRCLDVDMEKVDALLRAGLSFEDALTKLGVP